VLERLAMRVELLRRHLALLLVLVDALALAACAQEGGTATQPVPRAEVYWRRMHDAYVERAKHKDIELLFLGDSITQGWNDNETWKRYYGARKAANFGLGGDHTQHLLWRIQNGAIEGLNPKVVVLLIGTNNIGANTPEEIAVGIKAIVKTLRAKLPHSKLLLLGVLPRGVYRDKSLKEDKLDPRPAQINVLIQSLDDGTMIRYLDIGSAFLNDAGQPAKAWMPDFLHLSPEGYRRWADAMEPTLWQMLEGDGSVKPV
jgi:lysophospholipase L1-like esterase